MSKSKNGETSTVQLPCSARWVVRFRTRDGFFHPAWFSKTNGQTISPKEANEEADRYLAQNKRWLIGVAEIYPQL